MTKQIFHVKINGGKEQVIETKSGLYMLAVATALAILDYDSNENNEIVEIWCPKLIPEYGPYFYCFDGHNIYSISRPKSMPKETHWSLFDEENKQLLTEVKDKYHLTDEYINQVKEIIK